LGKERFGYLLAYEKKKKKERGRSLPIFSARLLSNPQAKKKKGERGGTLSRKKKRKREEKYAGVLLKVLESSPKEEKGRKSSLQRRTGRPQYVEGKEKKGFPFLPPSNGGREKRVNGFLSLPPSRKRNSDGYEKEKEKIQQLFL